MENSKGSLKENSIQVSTSCQSINSAKTTTMSRAASSKFSQSLSVRSDMPHVAGTTNANSNWENVLHIVTEMILIFFGIVVAISCVLSIGVAILGSSRKQKGLDYYIKSYHEQWEDAIK